MSDVLRIADDAEIVKCRYRHSRSSFLFHFSDRSVEISSIFSPSARIPPFSVLAWQRVLLKWKLISSLNDDYMHYPYLVLSNMDSFIYSCWYSKQSNAVSFVYVNHRLPTLWSYHQKILYFPDDSSFLTSLADMLRRFSARWLKRLSHTSTVKMKGYRGGTVSCVLTTSCHFTSSPLSPPVRSSHSVL